MADQMQSTRSIKVPRGVVVSSDDIVSTPTIGVNIGDPWVFVRAGAVLEISEWPADRVCVSPAKGKEPGKVPGAGRKALDALRDRGCLVPVGVELPYPSSLTLTHRETNVFQPDGHAAIEPVVAAETKPKKGKVPAEAKITEQRPNPRGRKA